MDEKDIRLRIVNNLEKGGEEIVADKPEMVFVQTHLSGFSPDILLMHLKKQLGRKRTRFVLLSPPDQVSDETLKLYQGQLDTSIDDNSLFDAIRELIAGLGPKTKKTAPRAEEIILPAPAQESLNSDETEEQIPTDQNNPEQQPAMLAQTGTTPSSLPVLHQLTEANEPTLEEQGVTYAPRSRVAVYSEFTSSFDSAVSSMQPAEKTDDQYEEQNHGWNHEEIETIEPVKSRSKQAAFLLWFAPLLVAVIVVTMIQHSRLKSKSLDTAAQTANLQPQPPSAPAIAAAPAVVEPKQASAPAAEPGAQTASTGADAQLSDKAMLQTITENRRQKEQSKAVPASPRLSELPDFIPRSGLDKEYGKTNPGWERYKGSVTEFKVYRENNTIKAIQVIDRGGQGVPESFMKGVLKQLSSKPVFLMESSEKKDGYEIQRGQIADNLKVVYYRDEKGGRLRAFVTTWK